MSCHMYTPPGQGTPAYTAFFATVKRLKVDVGKSYQLSFHLLHSMNLAFVYYFCFVQQVKYCIPCSNQNLTNLHM